MWLCGLFFFLGVLEDGLITLYYRSVSLRQDWLASFLSMAITVLAVAVVGKIVIDHRRRFWLYLTAYALGNGIGTFLAMHLK